ncbi:hypothetical protein [Staphylococcus epidermidis]|uniref:hypothetical protein n=1 Tax=Staphylococcus epidermidis TaxID=1282 RepID=UPI0037DA4AC5
MHLGPALQFSSLLHILDPILHILQTPSTLTPNRLLHKNHITQINPNLITNKQSYFNQSSQIHTLINHLPLSINYPYPTTIFKTI